jgi:hypothetical protein
MFVKFNQYVDGSLMWRKLLSGRLVQEGGHAERKGVRAFEGAVRVGYAYIEI